MWLLLISCLVGFGRFLVPGHDASWPGTYEAFAHIWVGVLLAWSFQKRRRAIVSLVALSALETLMFVAFKSAH
jgi:hypothetical protein